MRFIKDIIDKWDPMDLLAHAPSDEYHSEINEVKLLLATTKDPEVIAIGILDIFTKAFSAEAFKKSKAECRQIACALLERHEHETS